MAALALKDQQILTQLMQKGPMRSSGLHEMLTQRGDELSLVSVKRALSRLASGGFVLTQGAGRSTRHEISTRGRIATDVDARIYCAIDPDRRYGLRSYNFDLLPSIPSRPFTPEEEDQLRQATQNYRHRTTDLPAAIRKKELERLIIELSWKSSKIEGNTYSLLDTEKLILEKKEAPGHDHDEAIMILNHKETFQFLLDNRDHYTTLTRANLEELHRRLVKDLSVNAGLRHAPVGITGSVYRPLDNLYQIQDAVEALASAVSRMETPQAKALVSLFGIGYIQPFEDGNKRTARLMANGLLLAHHCAPLSYRSVEENDYREAMLTFYELNAIKPFRNIFVEQYAFAARHYAVP